MKGSFQICPLDDKPLWDGPTELYPPHRHDHQEIIVLIHGQATHHIDGEKMIVKAPSVFLVAEGKMHLFITQDKSRGWLIRFTNEYIPMDITNLFSQFTENSTISLCNKNLYTQVVEITRLMLKVYVENKITGLAVLQHLLAALLHLLENEQQRLAAIDRGCKVGDYQIFYAFLRLLDNCFKIHKSAGYYAQNLNMSSRKLGTICKAIFNKTPLKIIESRCIIEAKRLLLYTDDSIKQISFTLGFSDHSYFTKIFKRSTGFSPSGFRAHRSHNNS